MDDEDRENETDLILAAEFMTSKKMAFMVRYTTGIICVPLPCQRLTQLNIPLMVEPCENTEHMGTAFTISVDFEGWFSLFIKITYIYILICICKHRYINRCFRSRSCINCSYVSGSFDRRSSNVSKTRTCFPIESNGTRIIRSTRTH